MLNIKLNKIPSGDSVDTIDLEEISFETPQEMIINICVLLDELDCCYFEIEGFGERWPVDVYTDLSEFAQQLNESLKSVKNFDDFTINFHEQGVERIVNFKYENGYYRVSCLSLTDWKPEPEEDIEPTQIEVQLSEFKSTFIELVEEKIPQLKNSDLFELWKS